MKEIRLGKNGLTIVCNCHFSSVSDGGWYFDGRYVKRDLVVDGKRIRQYMHRVVANTPKGLVTDHVNGDKLDNRCSNLRIASYSENSVNSDPRNRNRYKGVTKYSETSSTPWRAMVAGKHVGVYGTAQEAAIAYNKVASEKYGRFARLNSA